MPEPHRDADGFDRLTDDLATGQDIYDLTEEVASGRGLRRYRHLIVKPSPPVGAFPPPRAGQPSPLTQG